MSDKQEGNLPNKGERKAALAPKKLAHMGELAGVRLASASAAITYKGRDDLALLLFDKPANVAGLFTRSACPSAPVDHCRKILPCAQARAVLVNAGNANAFTGARGAKTVELCAAALARQLDCSPAEIYIASTGVIGEWLDHELIIPHIKNLCDSAHASNWHKAAQAIRTTDSYSKMARRSFVIDGAVVNIQAIAKGAGMIAPNMATMLCFIVTDAAIEACLMQEMLSQAAALSFNSITIDSDCSTSDSVLFFATKAKAIKGLNDKDSANFALFQRQLNDLLLELALQIVRDGEGARHLIKVEVMGAANDLSAKKIGFAIANSPLVKTAISGKDANWGRVVMAVGKAGEPALRDKLDIYFGPHLVAQHGEKAPHYDEAKLGSYMQNDEILLRVDLNIGPGSAIVYGCDLTVDYVTLNGAYRS